MDYNDMFSITVKHLKTGQLNARGIFFSLSDVCCILQHDYIADSSCKSFLQIYHATLSDANQRPSWRWEVSRYNAIN